jgi:putative addiction module component (TIGR02574 family)
VSSGVRSGAKQQRVADPGAHEIGDGPGNGLHGKLAFRHALLVLAGRLMQRMGGQGNHEGWENKFRVRNRPKVSRRSALARTSKRMRRALQGATISRMGAEARQILEKALGLSEHERADLAAELMASLDGEPDADAEKAWAAEITSRAERALRGDTVGIPVEDVDAEARRILEGK